MSYQVLARKWRPKNFQELMGQEHVVTVLVNALTQQRLHHAYLFTGTRGVGKTTIARIFAKSLNCEQGITATPCGTCHACVDIDAGRFVDLLEIDAASRTKVDDTREILDNVQYAPSRGRYKVYLIDEVHMLSKSSFNALLKTLEEPPEHVKFILATTDPQKLPVTVLSRCLQFHLKALTPKQIETKLTEILHAEEVTFDEGTLGLLSKAARGSMRDCLSLSDQAIAQGQGHLTVPNLQQMLGGVDQNWVYKILIALVKQDSQSLMTLTQTIASYAPNYQRLLAELLQLLHQIAMWQLVPESVDVDKQRHNLLEKFSRAMSPEDVQLYYQIVLNGRRDLPFGFDEQAGFDMVVLRMLAFKPTQRELLPEQANVSAATLPNTAEVDSISDDLNQALADTVAQTSDAKSMAAKNTVASSANTAQKNTAPESTGPENTGPENAVEIIVESVNENVLESDTGNDPSPKVVGAQTPKMDTEVTTVPQGTQLDAADSEAIFPASKAQGEPLANVLEQASPIAAQADKEPQMLDIEQQGLEAQARDEGLWPQTSDIAPVSEQIPQTSDSQEPTPQEPTPQEPRPQEPVLAENNQTASEESTAALQATAMENVADTPATEPSSMGNSSVDNVLATRNMLRSRKKLVEGRAKKPQAVPTANTPAAQAAQEIAQQSDGIETLIEDDLPARQLIARAQQQASAEKEPEIQAKNQQRVVNIDSENGFSPELIDPTQIRDASQIDLWANMIDAMGLGGRLRQLALNAVLGDNCNDQQLHIILDSEFAHLQSQAAIDHLTKCYSLLKQQPAELVIDVQENVADTPLSIQLLINESRLQYAKQVIGDDEFILQLQQDFQAQVAINSIQAL
ncbi:DNA polymerase III subunit gamma/tau [Thalassotalea litorea]|uniref:DNA-directed DNA polymerase n=1 Tax=Thalassotalea litorea TaxID=2020715 RepID=A0A5R9IWL7_9GAMM|nr:DNA polymerase III subunit gamma/tau [Thalassotalea litorea]TLU67566.1 DNA polymerase III subunit gamma/tau [Thalassotalea litorea]